VHSTRRGDVLEITLSRPERRNALDAATIAELTAAFADVGDVRAVVLVGEGSSFSAGADLEWMRSSIALSYDENLTDAWALRKMMDAIDECPAPVVARVHGHAFGAGVGLVAAADIAVAHPDTLFAFSEVRLGIVPAVISPFVLAKIGASAARRYFLTGERFDAATALRIGLVHEVAVDVEATVEQLIGELRAGGPLAVRSAKTLAREQSDAVRTAELIAKARTSPEGQEGLRAFLERREANWATDA
jgi:methylglutaconyl-CoA hydratase